MTNTPARRRTRRHASSDSDAVNPKAVWLGLKGGRYKPLSDQDIQQIHHTALDVLENIGLANPIPELREAVEGHGCMVGDDGRLRFSRALVEEAIAQSPKHIHYGAPDRRNDSAGGDERYLCRYWQTSSPHTHSPRRYIKRKTPYQFSTAPPHQSKALRIKA